VPDSGGLLRLPALMPDRVARELLLTGRRLGAEEAARWGLANRVVPADQLMTAALDLAGRIAEAAPLAVAAVLEVLAATAGLGVHEAFAVQRSGHLPHYQAMLGSQDAVEGPRAFAEKRPPIWQGR
jgi:crotonobetainyl-CoA hydratase